MINRTKKRAAVTAVTVAAIAGLTLGVSLPAVAVTYVGAVTTTSFGITEFSGYLSGYYSRFSIHADKGYDYAASHVDIRHIQATASTTYYGPLAAPGSWSNDNLDYANVVRVGDYAYV